MRRMSVIVAAVLVLSMIFVGCNAIIDGEFHEYAQRNGLTDGGTDTDTKTETKTETEAYIGSGMEGAGNASPEETEYCIEDDCTCDGEHWITESSVEYVSEPIESNTEDPEVLTDESVDTTPVERPQTPLSELEEITISFKVVDVVETLYVTGSEIIIIADDTGDNKTAIELSPEKRDALIFDVKIYDDGTVSLGYCGYFLCVDDSGVWFIPFENECTRFVLEDASDGAYSYFIRSTAILSDEPHYLKFGDGVITSGAMDESAVQSYIFKFTDPEGADGSLSKP